MSLLRALLSTKRDYTQMLCVPLHSSSWLSPAAEGRDHNFLVWVSKPCIITSSFMIKVILYLYLKNKSNQTKQKNPHPLPPTSNPKTYLRALELKFSQVVSINRSYISSWLLTSLCYSIPTVYEEGCSWKSWLKRKVRQTFFAFDNSSLH